MTDASQALTALIEPVVTPLGLDLYDVELAGAKGRAPTLRVLVDRTGGGAVDLDAITEATRALSPVLDADAAAGRILSGAYTLEVSSPGPRAPAAPPRPLAEGARRGRRRQDAGRRRE